MEYRPNVSDHQTAVIEHLRLSVAGNLAASVFVKRTELNQRFDDRRFECSFGAVFNLDGDPESARVTLARKQSNAVDALGADLRYQRSACCANQVGI
jgi:hypothetical protein